MKGVYEGASAISFTEKILHLSLTASSDSAPRSGSRSAAEILAAPAEAPALSPPGGDTSGVPRILNFLIVVSLHSILWRSAISVGGSIPLSFAQRRI